MILMVRQQAAFVCPDVPTDAKEKKEAFAKAAKGKESKKQPQVRVPRGGSKGRMRLY